MWHAGKPRGNPRRSRRVGGSEEGASSLGSGCSEFTAAGIGGWVGGVEDWRVLRVPAVVVSSRFGLASYLSESR
jgi:hypothetical protein